MNVSCFLIQLFNEDESLHTPLMLFKSNTKVYGHSLTECLVENIDRIQLQQY